MKKILHITNWYPNKWDDLEGIFVQEQYKVFSEVTDSHLLNVQVRGGQKFFEYEHVKYSDSEDGYYLLTKIKSNKIIELLTTILLLFALINSKSKKYDVLHFHIAYPLLSHYFLWKKIIKIPILMSEHWSAYHFNFYMPWETKKLNGIKRIFKQEIPLITVSKALLKDIDTFSNVDDFPSTVIPNVIDQTCFFYKDGHNADKIPVFFAVNNWRKIKNPFPMLKGFAKLSQEGQDFKLILGGYGEELEDMKEFVKDRGFSQKVTFLGKMNKQNIAETLRKSDAYLFSSTYETFSVVCAQALCCGVPIIGPRLIAIEEYADHESYVSLSDNNAQEWTLKLVNFIESRDTYKREQIAYMANKYLSNKQIKTSYLSILHKWFP